MSNTPLNADDGLRDRVQDICDRIGAGLLPPTGAGAIMQLILADRKKHELQARIDELEQTVFKPMAGKTWLDIRPDVELMRQNERYKTLKAEREAL